MNVTFLFVLIFAELVFALDFANNVQKSIFMDNIKRVVNVTRNSYVLGPPNAAVVTAIPKTEEILNSRVQEIQSLRTEVQSFLTQYKIDNGEEIVATSVGKIMKLVTFRPIDVNNKTIRIDNNYSSGVAEAFFQMPDGVSGQPWEICNNTALVTFDSDFVGSSSGGDSELLSPVMGLSLFNESGIETRIKNLSKKIKIQIPLKPMNQSFFDSLRSKIRCGYFDLTLKRFLVDGVDTVDVQRTHAICNTSHLTDFGVFSTDTTTNVSNRLKDCLFFSDCDTSNANGGSGLRVYYSAYFTLIFSSVLLCILS